MKRAVLCILLAPVALSAQVDPSARWEELHTPHFRVVFTPPLEDQARRAAVNAERAYAALARELVPPRGTIDVVLADNVDFTNGSATPFPTNRIILYAHPPIDNPTLRYYGDWNALVIQHELTHIFHLDRARGWWRLAQRVFGRNPVVMPNLYTPAWLTEGLAVYYESRLTGFGRLAGTAHTTIADAAARDSALPRLDEVNLTSPVWPQAQGAYAYGSLLFEYLGRTRGRASIPAFIERESVQLIPFTLNHAARRAFGVSFERAWSEFRDSLERSIALAPPPVPRLSLQPLTHDGYEALFPRWRDSSAIIFAGNTERDLPGLYVVTLAGRERRLARRNGTSENAPQGSSSIVYDQLDFTTPYDIRSDLYRDAHGHTQRLTHGARLSYADTRPTAPGTIVAMQAVGATTRLVLVSADGRRIAPLTRATADTQWTAPRWSPDGASIAAVRWTRGAYTDIVILDTTGTVQRIITHSRSVESSPAWTPDGRRLLFTSDRTGRTEVYAADLGDGVVRRLGGAGAGVFSPAVSPDGRTLAVSAYRADGYHIAVGAYDTAAGVPVRDTLLDSVAMPASDRDAGPARRYRPWSGLVPRYWTPVVGQSDEADIEIGAFTSAYDVLQRHAYDAQLLFNPSKPGELEGGLGYSYSGLGLPVLAAGVSAYWTHQNVVDRTGVFIGLLVHRTVATSVSATLLHPRARTNLSWTVGSQLEFRDYHTEPAALLDRVDPVYRTAPRYPSVFTTVSWTNAAHPALSISPENGVAVTATGRQRWQWNDGVAAASRSVVGVINAYRALDLPGFAHHVIAVRAAVGWEDANATTAFGAGGRTGALLSVVPGVSVGDEPRVFSVRGYSANSQEGTRAATGAVEYRLPLFIPARGFHLFPVFLGRTSLTVFGDAGEAWCPGGGTLPAACSPGDVRRHLLASVGGELNLDATLQYDVPYRFRLGLAAPLANRQRYGAAALTPYVSLGVSF